MSNVYPIDQTVVLVEADGQPDFDGATGTTQIPLPDGTVEISFGAPPVARKSSGFDENLAEHLSEAELSQIAEKLLAGIEQDERSRSEWLENTSTGISLLGLQIKVPRGAATTGATPAEGTSVVDHPLLLEAVLRFQANASGELLPSDGPVKVRNDGESNALTDDLARALEKDLNHYLTKTAKEYYPDTDRMLFMLGFSGIAFKKGFHDPIRRRPVIESISAKDLIVSNAATDIDNAGRVTHRIMMKPSLLRRMQLVGAYRDISLPAPGMPTGKNVVDAKIDEIQGISPQTLAEPTDQDRELYECYCEIEIPGFEHTVKMDGADKPTGLPLPYKVTIDKEARRVLEIRRNWDEDDLFCMPRNRIVAYTFIPGLGFYGIGLLNVLGNAARAMTAAWRLMIDAGMFSNFPGFLYLKSLAKQLTNQFRIAPGSGMPIDTIGNDIRASVMPLPYKDPSAVFIQLMASIEATAQRVGGTAELQIGEGKQNAPVGTTLALIEQATKLMSAVHKRLHQAQGQEFDMLKSLLAEDPEALWRHNKKSAVLRCLARMAGQGPILDMQQAFEDKHRAMFLAALADCELIPRADPNTSSQTERYLKVVAMRQMAMTNPSLDINKIDQRAFQTMGVDDGASLFKQMTGPPEPSPEDKMAEATKVAAQARLADSRTKAVAAAHKSVADAQNLATKEKIASLNVARELVVHNADRSAQQQSQGEDQLHDIALATIENRAASEEAGRQRIHDAMQKAFGRQHQAQQADVDQQGVI